MVRTNTIVALALTQAALVAADCCLTTGLCPAGKSLSGTVDAYTACCVTGQSINLSGDTPMCSGSDATPTQRTDLWPLGCCLTSDDTCIDGTSMTGNSVNDQSTCCVDTSMVMTDNLTPQCSDSYVSDNAATGVVFSSAAMIGAAIVAAQLI